MDKMVIEGGWTLSGTVPISGAKNAALPLMAACLLTDKPYTLHHAPQLADVQTMRYLLDLLGVASSVDETGAMTFYGGNLSSTRAVYDVVRKMRASILVLGPLLAKKGHAEVSLPGGCAIGLRPVDLHIKAMESLGASVRLEDGYIVAEAPSGGLQGAEFTFPVVSVTGTENMLMAAVLAHGKTRIINAAREPEIVDLARCLKSMGACISGEGTEIIDIEGVPSLEGTAHTVIPDRVEAGTYAIAAIMTRGQLRLAYSESMHLTVLWSLLQSMGASVDIGDGYVDVHYDGPLSSLQPLSVHTAPYPGFPTDLQAQLMTLLSVAGGESFVHESIFDNRFMHVAELTRMGADIHINGAEAVIHGGQKLKGTSVMATDLRASASLVLAGLVAEGVTTVQRIYHLDRGYDSMEYKLGRCGARIKRVS